MQHIGLFAGMGGFEYAASLMNWNTVAWCENDSFCQHILKYHFPDAIAHGDIKQTDFTPYANTIDILTGGFPCQPYSIAGKRRGKDDERHLWPEMRRAIREVQPPWVVGENVYGLINWNAGMVFNEVQAELEAEGYEVWPYVLPAAGVNAPHQRYRIWFIAYSNRNRIKRRATNSKEQKKNEQERCNVDCETTGHGAQRTIANARSKYSNVPIQQRRSIEAQNTNPTGNSEARFITDANSERRRSGWTGRENAIHTNPCSKGNGLASDFTGWPTQSPLCFRDNGLSARLDATALFGKPCKPKGSRSFGKWRSESIKAGGNAVVPQVVLQIFKAIEQYEQLAH